MLIEKTFEFNATPTTVWQFIVDPKLQKKWMSGLIDNRLTEDETHRIGSKFIMRVREGNKIAQYEGEVESLQTHEELGIVFWGGNFKPGSKMFVNYRLTSVNTTDTTLYYKARMEVSRPSLVLKLFMPLIRAFSIIQIKSFMRKLKDVAEYEQSRAARHVK